MSEVYRRTSGSVQVDVGRGCHDCGRWIVLYCVVS